MYAGFELCEHVAVKPGSEEYLDSEKYQLRPRDWTAHDKTGTTLAPYLTLLNEIRNQHPALHELRNLVVHRTDDDAIVCFSKAIRDLRTGEVTDAVIAVLTTDPHNPREATVHLDLPALGLDWSAQFMVTDLVTGQEWQWGGSNYVRLDPHQEPAHILTIRRLP